MTEAQPYLLDAQWTNDCQGKKDYDGDIVSISTRYWPRGGGYGFLVANEKGQVDIQTNVNPAIRPHAHTALVLYLKDEERVTLIDENFYGETEEEVKQQVEVFAQAQMDKVVDLLRTAFPFSEKGVD